eukprot:8583337-Pyramimonas_sp.AAC.2
MQGPEPLPPILTPPSRLARPARVREGALDKWVSAFTVAQRAVDAVCNSTIGLSKDQLIASLFHSEPCTMRSWCSGAGA